MNFVPHNYQEFGVQHILKNPYCGLFLEMGLGKTVTALTAVDILKYDMFEVSKVLVIAPLRVADHTWSSEIDKWEHLKHLTTSKVLGNERKRKEALRKEADIYIINRENVPWLVAQYGSAFPFDLMIIDELSSFKDPKTNRFKALRQVRPLVKRVIGLTGTPAPNGLINLWSQMYLLDRGERLGKTLTSYRNQYFTPGDRNGQVVFNYKLLEGSEASIKSKIQDICISMKTEDYLRLPERIDNMINIIFDDKTQKQYNEFEREQVLKLYDSEEITAMNAAALTNKLLQFSNGAVYDEDKNVVEIHRNKIKELEDIIENSNNKPVLVFYSYKHDKDRILKLLKRYKPRELRKGSADIEDWNNGKIQLLLTHPASAGHGLNLQTGGNIIVWFGMTWSLELYQQANARLYRQGQKESVIIHHLITEGTMDDDVMMALSNKADSQEALMQSVKARIDKYTKNLKVV